MVTQVSVGTTRWKSIPFSCKIVNILKIHNLPSSLLRPFAWLLETHFHLLSLVDAALL